MNNCEAFSITPERMLASLSPFAELETNTISSLNAVTEIQKVGKGEGIFQQGDSIHHVHFLISGTIKRSTSLFDHTERVLGVIKPGEAICLSEALCSITYRSTAHAIEASQVLAIPVPAFRNIVQRDGKFGLQLLEYLARDRHATEFEVVTHYSLPANQRVLDYLLLLAGNKLDVAGETTIHLVGSKSLVASRLDMTPETLSRTLKQLQTDGVIVVHNRQIHLQNAALRIYALPFSINQSNEPRYSRREKRAAVILSPATLINLCGRLRMLSQRIATAWVLRVHAIRVRLTKASLRKYCIEFENLLTRLGSSQLPESLRSTVNAIVHQWESNQKGIIDQSTVAHSARDIFDSSEEILKLADQLTTEVTRSAGIITYEHINIAGRSRMLSARIVKLLMFQFAGLEDYRATSLIDHVRCEFVVNAQYLKSYPGNTTETLAQLELVISQWETLLKVVDQISHNNNDRKRIFTILDISETLLRHTDTLVKIYELLATPATALHGGQS